MRLSDVARSRADLNLQAAIEKAQGGDLLHAVFFLNSGGESASKSVQPSGFADAKAYRCALIQRQTETLQASTGPTRQHLETLGLTVSGGSISSAVVVAGSATALAAGLESPGVHKALLDVVISLPRTRKSPTIPKTRAVKKEVPRTRRKK
jgi:hypothetical protein